LTRLNWQVLSILFNLFLYRTVGDSALITAVYRWYFLSVFARLCNDAHSCGFCSVRRQLLSTVAKFSRHVWKHTNTNKNIIIASNIDLSTQAAGRAVFMPVRVCSLAKKLENFFWICRHSKSKLYQTLQIRRRHSSRQSQLEIWAKSAALLRKDNF